MAAARQGVLAARTFVADRRAGLLSPSSAVHDDEEPAGAAQASYFRWDVEGGTSATSAAAAAAAMAAARQGVVAVRTWDAEAFLSGEGLEDLGIRKVGGLPLRLLSVFPVTALASTLSMTPALPSGCGAGYGHWATQAAG